MWPVDLITTSNNDFYGIALRLWCERLFRRPNIRKKNQLKVVEDLHLVKASVLSAECVPAQ